MKNFFITASGTEVGKTLVTTALCWQLRQRGIKVTALKPIVTGFKDDDENSDPAQILRSCGLHPTPAVMKTIAPWQYEAPLAPHMAARDVSQIPERDDVVAFCQSHTGMGSNIVLVEGFGGVMAPLNHSHTLRDVMEVLGWPVILVGGNYLGAISHTLAAYEALRIKDIDVHALVLSESSGSNVSFNDTVETVEKFVARDIPIVKIPRLHEGNSKWKQAPSIHWLVDDERRKAIV